MKHITTILAGLCILGVISLSFAADTTSNKLPAEITPEQFAEFNQQALQGDAKAQYNLGICYEKGMGMPKDEAKAVELCLKSAKNGLAEAQYMIGYRYLAGAGVARDMAEAVKWFQKAAEQGNIYAQNNLGICYAYGMGVKQDYIQAYRWVKLAERGGNPNAKGGIVQLDKILTDEQKRIAMKLIDSKTASKPMSPAVTSVSAPRSSAVVSAKERGTASYTINITVELNSNITRGENRLMVELRQGAPGNSKVVDTKYIEGRTGVVSFSNMCADSYFIAIGNGDTVAVGPVHKFSENENRRTKVRVSESSGNIGTKNRSGL